MLDQLKAQKRWFCWKLETRPGQDNPTKKNPNFFFEKLKYFQHFSRIGK